jgi:glycerol-3-phosphate dehydrogenase (NAD(P)+)
VAKGVEQKTLKRPSEIINELLGARRICVLSGPSHAEEVARRLPACVVAASHNQRLAQEVQQVFMNDRLRVYTHNDVPGVELGGALKNIIAIAAGICEGLKLGDNARAALMSRGMIEMGRLGVALGARKSTFFGLAGIGDLITTCVSRYGRNREVGLRIARGETLTEILKRMEQVAEGVWTTRAVVQLARRYQLDMPITQEVYKVLYKGKPPLEAMQALMQRAPKSELVDL